MNCPSWLSEGDNTSYEGWVQSGEIEKRFLAHSAYHSVFILSALSLCSSALHSKRDKHVLRNLKEWKKTLPAARFKVSTVASGQSAGKIFLTVSVCSVSTANTSLLPWCDVFQCVAPGECPAGGTRDAPRQSRASTWGFSPFFLFFFPWHLRFVTRCHRPDQSFDRLPVNCVVCHPQLWVNWTKMLPEPLHPKIKVPSERYSSGILGSCLYR